MAILGLAQTNKIENHNKKKIITSAIEHKCVLNSAHHAAKVFGLELVICPVSESGRVDIDFLAQNIDEETLLVSIMAVNNEVGTEQPIDKIGALTREKGVIFHVDAAQAAYLDIDMIKDNISLLSLSGHKLYAPKGIGALIVSEDLPLPLTPILHGGNQQKGLRSGTLSPALCYSLASAINILIREGGEESRLLKQHKAAFLQSLAEAGIKFKVNGSLKSRHPGNLNIYIEGIEAATIINNLQPHMAISTGSACNSGIIKNSYVLEAMGYSNDRISSSIRFGFGRFNLLDNVNEYTEQIKLTMQNYLQTK